MDGEGSEETVTQPPAAEGEPPSAEEQRPKTDETGSPGTPRERGEVSEREETTEPAAAVETETAQPEEDQVEGDGAARESVERGPEADEKKGTEGEDVHAAAEGEEEGETEDGGAKEASTKRDEGKKAETENGGNKRGEGEGDDTEGSEGKKAETEGGEGNKAETEGANTEGGEGERAEAEVAANPMQTLEVPKDLRRKEKDKKKRKKTKTLREEGTRSSPRSRKKASRSRGGNNRQMEEILLALFLPFDPEGNGAVDSTTFWEIIQSPELNLQLESSELAALQEIVTPDRSGLISYAKFAAQASDIVSSLYHDKPQSEDYRVSMATPSGHRILSYNKQTGQFQDLVEEGVDPFEENIQGLFQSADTEGRGFITREEFIALFQVDQLALLTEDDHSQMTQYFDQVAPAGQAQYTDFYRLGKELILRLYRNQDNTDLEWIELQSEKLGRYQLNKYTGEIQRDTAAPPASHAHPQIDLVNHAFQEVQQAAFETEQYKEENRELQNQLRLMSEEQETLTVQLEQTGHVLDEANTEIREKEEEIGRLQALLEGKDHEIGDLKAKLGEAEESRERLHKLEHELESVQQEVEARGQSVEARDSSMVHLQKQSHRVVDKLKTAWANVDARDSKIAKLQHQLHTEQGRMKTYEEQTPLLEDKVSALEEEVKRLDQSVEEKNSAISTSRKHLKNSRERNMELEKVAERAVQTGDKLKGAESEIRTLKGLLTSKTAMVERRKRELGETRVRLGELEERDSRRATILADVLERTARQYQQTLHVGGARGAESAMNLDPQLSLSSSQNVDLARRPVSAPSVPPDQTLHLPPGSLPHTSQRAHPPQIVRTYAIPGSGGRPGAAGGTKIAAHRGQPGTRTAPRLPPIRRRGKSLPPSTFHMPTAKELRQVQQRRDKEMVQHSESNPRCTCQLCAAGGATAESMDGVRLGDQLALAGLTGAHEITLARQLSIGQRILVSMKRSEFDLEPQKYTGMVKYVGKIDNEFIDNRIYVGVKLDEPVGDSDGLLKGKRYFHCPAKHGKIVRLSNVEAILPRSSVSYRQLPSTKKSPYTSAPASHKRARVKVT